MMAFSSLIIGHSFSLGEKQAVRKKECCYNFLRIHPHQSPRVDFLPHALHLQSRHSQHYNTTISDSVVCDALSHARTSDATSQLYDTSQVSGKLQQIYWVDHMVGRMLESSYFLSLHTPCNGGSKPHLPPNRHNP